MECESKLQVGNGGSQKCQVDERGWADSWSSIWLIQNFNMAFKVGKVVKLVKERFASFLHGEDRSCAFDRMLSKVLDDHPQCKRFIPLYHDHFRLGCFPATY